MPRRIACLVMAAASLAAVPAVRSEEGAAAPGRAVSLTFDRKLAAGDEGYREGFDSFVIRFGPGDWEGTRVVEGTGWGDGNDGKDLWGWPDGAEAGQTETRTDDRGAYFVYGVKAGFTSRRIAANFRLRFADGSPGVANVVVPVDGTAHDVPAGPALSLAPRATFTGHPALVYSVGFTADGKTVVSGSAPDIDIGRANYDTVIAWAVPAGPAAVRPAATAGRRSAASVAGRKVVIPVQQSVEGFDFVRPTGVAVPVENGVTVFDLRTGRALGTLAGPPMTNAVCVAVAADGRTAAAGYFTGELIVWDMRSGKTLRSTKAHDGPVRGIAYSPDGKQIATAGDRTFKLWDAASGAVRQTLRPEDADTIASKVRYSADGDTLVSVETDGPVRFWDPKTGELRRTFPGHEQFGARAADLSPDGARLATSSANILGRGTGYVQLWDAATGAMLAEATDADGIADDVAFAPDGKTLASGGGDTVKLWAIEDAP